MPDSANPDPPGPPREGVEDAQDPRHSEAEFLQDLEEATRRAQEARVAASGPT